MTREVLVAVAALAFLILATLVGADDDCGPPADRIAEIESHWTWRDRQPECRETIALLEAALAAYPGWEDGWIWLGYARFMEGENWPEGDGRRQESYQAGMDAAKKAIALNERSAGGHHWYIANKACYGRERGILRSVVYLPEVLREIKTVKSIDPHYDAGGPQRLVAGIICAAPAMLRSAKGYSLADAEAEMKDAIAFAPNHPRNRLFLADVYIEMGNGDAAREQLVLLLDMNEKDVPQWAAELRLDQAAARKKVETLDPRPKPGAKVADADD